MRKEQQFVHLRVHSSYSLLEGAITPQGMVDLCKKNNQNAVAITDSGNLFGSLEFSNTCAKNGIQPIIGCIVNFDLQENKNATGHARIFDKILLIAKDKQGYSNLLELVSKSFLETEGTCAPHITLPQLERLNDGLIVLTGSVDGPINRMLLEKRPDEANKTLLKLKDIFGDRLYIELMRHGQPEEEQTEDALIEMAYEHNIPLVATNDVYFADRSIHKAHDALMCIADGRYVSETDRKKVSQDNYFKSTREMAVLFDDIPEAIENTINIAKRCSVMSENHAPMLPHFACEEGRTEADELRAVALEGLRMRLKTNVLTGKESEEEKKAIEKEYFDRIEYELGIIINMDFPGYFLIVSDFMRWSNRNNIPVGPGRGSGAGSVVAWALEITDLDPLRFGLLFERFLNPERVSMPDFDIDFCQEKRERVIRYVQEKYGHDKVAQIITFGKLQARAVIRDVGRVLQMPYGQIDRISKMIPFNPIDPVTLSKAIDMDRVFREMISEDREISELVDVSLKLEGLNRHASTHAAGVVIADRPLYELVPVYRDPRSDMPVCGYSMKYAESAGLVKFDFLGLKTLTVIAKTIELIKLKNIDVDISQIPLEDKPTFEMLSKGDSVGVFQLESAGMRDTLRKLKPDNIEDIIAIISLYRPGPMDNIPSYIARKHGTEEPDYLDPMLEEVLKETYGVIIYQEQVMQIAQIMGGYSLGAADLLRRAMGKKIAAEMDAQRKIFVDGAIKNNVDKSKASSIFDLVAKFAGYGFNKSHAAAYAMISYRTAYLKAHYPVEFIAASMNLEINDTDKINTFRQEAVTQGIEILPPDINKSQSYFMPETAQNGELAIRYGLGALKNVGIAAMDELIAERNSGGDYKDIFDMAKRVNNSVMNKRQMESLIKCGAFDYAHENRQQIYEAIEPIMRYNTMVNQEKNSNQNSLFGGESDIDTAKPKLPDIEDWPNIKRMHNEFSAAGLYLNQHPLSLYEKILQKIDASNFASMSEKLSDGSSYVKIAGVVISRRMRSSPKGRFATVSLSDPSGIFEVSVFNEDLISEARELLENGSVILLEAEARKDEGGIRLTASSIKSLDEAVFNSQLKIYISNIDSLDMLKHSLGSKVKGKTIVTLVAEAEDYKLDISLPETYNIPTSTIEDMKNIAGISQIEEL